MVYPEEPISISAVGTGPNGRTINYNYGDTGGVLMSNSNAMLDNAIGRLNSISDAGTGNILEQYSYLGLSTIVARNHPQTGINLTLIGSGGSIGAGGDEYVGLDQFGRVVNQNWIQETGGRARLRRETGVGGREIRICRGGGNAGDRRQELGDRARGKERSAVSLQRLAISHWLSVLVVASDPGDEKQATKWK